MISEQLTTVSGTYAAVGSIAAVGSSAYTIYLVVLAIVRMLDRYDPTYYYASIFMQTVFVVTSASPFLFLFRSSFTQCRLTAVVVLLTIHSVLCIEPLVYSIFYIVFDGITYNNFEYQALIILLVGGLGILMTLLRGKALLQSQQPSQPLLPQFQAPQPSPVDGYRYYQPNPQAQQPVQPVMQWSAERAPLYPTLGS